MKSFGSILRYGRALAIVGVSGAIGTAAHLSMTDKHKFSLQAAVEPLKALTGSALSNASALADTTNRPITPWDDNWDKRDPERMVKALKEGATTEEKIKRHGEVASMLPKAKRVLVLVRHGQYDRSAHLDEDSHLTELGKEQAVMTGQRLAEMFKHYRKHTDENGNHKQIEVSLVKSTMTRATETADIMMQHMPEIPSTSCDLIREGAPCIPEPPHPEWNPSPQEFFEEGARIEAGFRKYIHRADPEQKHDSVEVLVCHGNVIRYFVTRALQLPPEAWLRFSVHNGSITVLTISPTGRVAVTALGEAGHFPVEKLSFQ